MFRLLAVERARWNFFVSASLTCGQFTQREAFAFQRARSMPKDVCVLPMQCGYFVFGLRKPLEMLRKIFAYRAKIAEAAFDAAYAVGVVVAKFVHCRQFYASPQEQRFTGILRQSLVDQRRNDRPIRPVLAPLVRTPLFFCGVAEHKHIARLFKLPQQIAL